MAKHQINIGHLTINYGGVDELTTAARKKYEDLDAEIQDLERQLETRINTKAELAKFLGIKRARASSDGAQAPNGSQGGSNA